MPRHSPVILALLLAATLSVDAVAVYWHWAAPRGILSKIFYLGLTFGQVSVCCIWSSLGARRIRLPWLLPYIVGLFAVLGMVPAIQAASRWAEFFQGLWLYWTHVTVLIALIWLLTQSRVGRRMTGDADRPRWQISILQLLGVTTVVALTIAWWEYADLRQMGFILTGIWLGNTVGVAAAAAVTLSGPQSSVRRIAMFAVATGALAFALYLGGRLAGIPPLIVAAFCWLDLIQAIVLALWLELTPIIPRRAPAAAAGPGATAAARTPSQAE